MATVSGRVESYYRSLLSTLAVGDRLPSERQVMRDLDTCRSTIRLVLTKLVTEKLLYPEHGRGYFKA